MLGYCHYNYSLGALISDHMANRMIKYFTKWIKFEVFLGKRVKIRIWSCLLQYRVLSPKGPPNSSQRFLISESPCKLSFLEAFPSFLCTFLEAQGVLESWMFLGYYVFWVEFWWSYWQRRWFCPLSRRVVPCVYPCVDPCAFLFVFMDWLKFYCSRRWCVWVLLTCWLFGDLRWLPCVGWVLQILLSFWVQLVNSVGIYSKILWGHTYCFWLMY